jgi:hypothetical protein
MEITNSIGGLDDAVLLVQQTLFSQHKKVIKTTYTHRGRHALIVTEDQSGRLSGVYVFFKREFFYTFGKIFNTEGVGETMNSEVYESIKRSLLLEEVLFVYGNGKVYSISPKKLMEYVTEYRPFRLQKNNEEVTVSFPVGLLTRWETKSI